MSLAAFVASLLTFFSGFGLGTLLLPVFSLFFGPSVGVVFTAIIHFLNNIFKGLLLRRQMEVNTALRFALFAIPAAIAGSWCLFYLEDLAVISLYDAVLGNWAFQIDPLGLVIGSLMLVFGLLEMSERFQRFSFPPGMLWLGGVLSGFFGGLSGHQGALRSAFLIRLNLGKEQYIATGVLIALFIDLTRLPFYLYHPFGGELSFSIMFPVLFSAWLGSWLGNRFLKKISVAWIRLGVALFLILSGLVLLSGVHHLH